MGEWRYVLKRKTNVSFDTKNINVLGVCVDLLVKLFIFFVGGWYGIIIIRFASKKKKVRAATGY